MEEDDKGNGEGEVRMSRKKAAGNERDGSWRQLNDRGLEASICSSKVHGTSNAMNAMLGIFPGAIDGIVY